jgi:hypothetical protein
MPDRPRSDEAVRIPQDGASSLDRVERAQVLGLLCFGLIIAAYWIVRSGGQWADNDSAFMANAIRTVARDGRIVPDAAEVYANGYGYQVISSAVLAFSGISVPTLQQYIYPLLSVFVVLPAWAAYRELLGSARTATLTTLILFLVPGYLFTLLRGSHERLDRVFIFAMLWLLVRSARTGQRPLVSAIHAALIAVLGYGLVATNDLFGMSMFAAMAIALGGAWVLQAGPANARVAASRIVRHSRWVTAAGFLALAIFMLFVYEPAGHSLRQMLQVPTGIISTLLREAPTAPAGPAPADGDPYAGIVARWIHPGVYFLLSLGEYVLIIGSAVAWLRLGWLLFRRRIAAQFGPLFLWLLYAAFALQFGAAVFSGGVSVIADNLQYRSFTVFALVAAPMLAHGLVASHLARWPKPLLRTGLAFMVVAALFKATNEPLVGNNWTFYTEPELAGLQWADANQRATFTWIGPDERLSAAYGVAAGVTENMNRWAFRAPEPIVRAFLISDGVRTQSARLGLPLPAVHPHNRVYDSGSVQLYRTRAIVPFQR